MVGVPDRANVFFLIWFFTNFRNSRMAIDWLEKTVDIDWSKSLCESQMGLRGDAWFSKKITPYRPRAERNSAMTSSSISALRSMFSMTAPTLGDSGLI